jgi:predicted Zn-dependent protease
MIERWIRQFSLFLGPARLRAFFLLIAVTGLTSLILNAVNGEWVVTVQTLLAVIAVGGSLIILLGRMESYDRGRWLALLLPAFGALVLGIFVVPQYLLPLAGAGFGWIVAGLLLFRSRSPMEYQKAVKHLRKSEFAEAVKTMDGLIKEQPDTPEHLRFRAELLRVWGKLDRAKRDYRKMTELDPNSAVAYNGLAEVSLQAGDYQDALVAGRRAAELAPDEWVAMYNLGMIEDRLGNALDAAVHLERAIALKVPDARHRLLIDLYLARAYARLGEAARAQDAVLELRKHKSGLDEWDTILKSEQADTLRAVIGDDVIAARELASGKMDVMTLAVQPKQT